MAARAARVALVVLTSARSSTGLLVELVSMAWGLQRRMPMVLEAWVVLLCSGALELARMLLGACLLVRILVLAAVARAVDRQPMAVPAVALVNMPSF